MTTMKRSFFTVAILTIALLIGSQLVMSCGGKKDQATEIREQTKPDSTAVAYACPMHPEVTGKEGVTCSKCGMELVAVKNRDSTMHEH
jgi:hypothetical protein